MLSNKKKVGLKKRKQAFDQKKRKKTRLRPGKKVRNQDLVHVKKKKVLKSLFFFLL